MMMKIPSREWNAAKKKKIEIRRYFLNCTLLKNKTMTKSIKGNRTNAGFTITSMASKIPVTRFENMLSGSLVKRKYKIKTIKKIVTSSVEIRAE